MKKFLLTLIVGTLCLSACNSVEQSKLPPLEEYLSWDAMSATPEQMEVYNFVEESFKKAVFTDGTDLKLDKKVLKELGFPKDYIDTFTQSLEENWAVAKEWEGVDIDQVMESIFN